MSLKANFETTTVLLAILINLVIIFLVLKSLDTIERNFRSGRYDRHP